MLTMQSKVAKSLHRGLGGLRARMNYTLKITRQIFEYTSMYRTPLFEGQSIITLFDPTLRNHSLEVFPHQLTWSVVGILASIVMVSITYNRS